MWLNTNSANIFKQPNVWLLSTRHVLDLTRWCALPSNLNTNERRCTVIKNILTFIFCVIPHDERGEQTYFRKALMWMSLSWEVSHWFDGCFMLSTVWIFPSLAVKLAGWWVNESHPEELLVLLPVTSLPLSVCINTLKRGHILFNNSFGFLLEINPHLSVHFLFHYVLWVSRVLRSQDDLNAASRLRKVPCALSHYQFNQDE